MSNERPPIPIGVLSSVVLAYGTASLMHHVHNAEFLDAYPNMPAWLSRALVYAAWCGVTAVGVGGVALVWRRWQLAGLSVLGVYGAFGLDGLGHYAAAPVSAHTVAMNLTIWLEVTTGLVLLAVVATVMRRLSRENHHRPRDVA